MEYTTDRNALLDSDLEGIKDIMRIHIEIRNRSFMRRVHRDCFLGSDAVDFLCSHGLADSRPQAVQIGKKMCDKAMMRHVSDSKQFKDASHMYYRFIDDDKDEALLAATNAGNGTGVPIYGQGGNSWAFCPHTVNNSYIIDIGLAEEIERSVAGSHVDARQRAFEKLRNRVREEAEPEAPNWSLTQSQIVHGTPISVYQRKRPRGDFKNLRMTGMVGEKPKKWIRGIMSFEKRKQWESMFEDGIVVEGIDLGESSILEASYDSDSDDEKIVSPSAAASSQSPQAASGALASGTATPAPGKASSTMNLAQPSASILNFLQTIELAGIPAGMSIAFLNDQDRQHALAHLRKQMMLSSPQDCMLCMESFEAPSDIRFCPCCAMVSCHNCVCKRVFEAATRRVVVVCLHCYRESSRIRHPPSAVKNTANVDESVRGKWWRPEELNLIDYSTSMSNSMTLNGGAGAALMGAHFGGPPVSSNAPSSSKYGQAQSSAAAVVPDTIEQKAGEQEEEGGSRQSIMSSKVQEQGDGVGREVDEDDDSALGAVASGSAAQAIQKKLTAEHYATCKSCGAVLQRDVDVIERHMDSCNGTPASSFMDNSGGNAMSAAAASPSDGGLLINGKDINKSGTRIIYRTARQDSTLFNFRPREVCAIQDSFTDPDGTAYVYEISVRHCDVRGTPGYVTADVLMQMYVARPVPGSNGASSITIVSQVDTRAKGPGQWFLSLVGDNSDTMAGPAHADLVRELEASGPLVNILKPSTNSDGFENENDSLVNLDDFELLAVLGRGGFGKVMQVKHKQTEEIYAMKILKKNELVRRRQVERTQTERTILAAVKHPFIVCLHYAFQNVHKLYMVMDFVQGGDFFTLMRKHRRLPEDWVRIYVGEIAMALQHLHDMDVVYRDLKPENILLCSDGHVKLTDFGLSHDIVTRSFCGTEQYMSPEMLLQHGHNFRMDWWCLGLIMHEMISAKHPFHGPSHYDTLRNMVTKQPVIDNRLSVHAATVVRSLLIKNPRARLCCRAGFEELKSLPWFSSLDWDALYEKKINMAYRPDLQGDEDVSSFETTFTREEAIDSVTSDASAKSGKKKGGANDGENAFQDFGFVKDVDSEPPSPAVTATDTENNIFKDVGGDTISTNANSANADDAKSISPILQPPGQESGDHGMTAFIPAQPIRKSQI
eukprot:GSChrysophyteH2.ASY1.ANO1.392.1 assembled CDS